MKVLNRSSIYAIRALIYIERHGPADRVVGIGEISENLKISFHFLTKILQVLTKRNILKSNRGPGGGVGFNIPSDQILLSDIVAAFEEKEFFETCLLGLSDCQDENPCPVHDFWKTIRSRLKDRLERTTISELSRLEGRIGIEQLSTAY